MRPPLFVVDSDPVLRRWRAFRLPAVVGAVVGLLVGLGVHQLTPVVHTAQVTVELTAVRDQLDLDPTGVTGRLVSFDTDAQVARSDAVVGVVAADQQRSLSAVREALTVSARPNSRILLLSYAAPTADGAERGAALAARTFLQERERLFIEPQREFLADVYGATAAVDPEFDLVDVADTLPPREVIRRRAFVEQLGLSGPGRIVGEVAQGTSADRGDIEVPLTSGAATGALLAVLAVLLADLVRRRPAPSPPQEAPPRLAATGRGRPRRRATALLGAAAMVVLAACVSVPAAVALVPQGYEGQARVYVPPERGNAFSSLGSRTARRIDSTTEAELVRSDEVLARVSADPAVDLTPRQLRARTRGVPAVRGEVVEITFQGRSREEAATVVPVVAEQLVAARERRAARYNAERRAAVDAAVAAAEADLQAALGPLGSRDLVSALNRRLDSLRTDARVLVGNREDGGEVLFTRVERDASDQYVRVAVAAAGPLLGLLVAVATRGGTRLPLRRRRRRHQATVRPVRWWDLAASQG